MRAKLQEATPPRPEHVAAAPHQWADRAELLPTFLFVTAIGLQVFVAWKFWALTWDDSAITLGFSRTFAMTGRIEPTPGSGIVEGYSSTLWMLLMAAVAKVVHNPQALLTVAKLATLSLNIGSLFLMRAWLGSWMPKALATLAAGICGCSFMHYETINGMETPLLLALILCMLLWRASGARKARWLYLATGVAVVLTRWEALWLLVPFVLMERTLRRSVVSASVWVAAFGLASVLRRVYFGAYVPNTILAKRGAPYLSGSAHEQFGQHVLELRSIASYAVYFALIVLFFLLLRGRLSRHQSARWSWEFKFTALFLAFSLVLTGAIGYNWGPPLRSFYTAWPFLFALLLFPLAAEWGTPGLRRSMLVVVGAMSLLTFVRAGRVVRELSSPYAPIYMPNATVADISNINHALQTVQQATGRQQLLFAGPDMGAVMLFSNGIRVIDLGLLCNRTLARERYGAIETYVLEQQKPDVIEVHGIWTPLTALDVSRRFHDDYRPVIVNGRRMFLRNSLIAFIPAARLREARFVPGMNPDAQAYGPEDTALSSSFGSYLTLQQ